MGWFGKKNKSSVDLPFKSGADAFEYACKFMNTEIAEGIGFPALVRDACIEFGTEVSVRRADDGIQTVALSIPSEDGGFLVLAQTAGQGPDLKPGDLVAWIAMQYDEKLVMSDDLRSGWMGIIAGTLEPRWTDGNWKGGHQFK